MEKSGFLKRALLNVSDRELFIKLKLSIIPIIIISLITVGVYWSSFNLVIYPGYIRIHLARVAYVTRLYTGHIEQNVKFR